MNFDFKKLVPHVIAIVIFALVAIVYCKPSFQGKVLNQHDNQGWKGMAQQSFEVKEKTGKFPLWTNSMFGGMPAYQIAMQGSSKIGAGINFIEKATSLWLPEPAVFFFLAALCFYILCLVLGANPWVAIFGGLAYAYSTYNPIIVSVGHNTKMMGIAYAPMVIAGLMLLFQKKYLLGFLITALFATITIGQNHLQVVYYLLIITGCITVAALIKAVKEKEVIPCIKAAALGLVAGLIGLGVCAGSILPTYDYSKETMRGGVSQLSLNASDSLGNKTKGGLDKDYALRWSVGQMETFTFMVPGLYGGSNGGNEHSASSQMVEKFGEIGVPEENALPALNSYSYWGSMSSLSETTSGPVYLGAIICFLFIIGLFYLNTWHKWWVIAASLIGILLAWGSNFMALNALMLDYLPFYSKFRAPSMALIIPQFCIPVFAVLTLSKLVAETSFDIAYKKLKRGVIAAMAVLAVIMVFWLSADYTGKGDKDIKQGFVDNFSRTQAGQQPNPQALQQAQEISKDLMTALRSDRKNEAGADLLRTFLLFAAAGVIIWLMLKKKISALVATVILIVVSLFDLINVDQRYLNHSSFKEADEVSDAFIPSPADQQILQDPDHANFRVFNQTQNFTSESLTSYHHNSIGGYSPAKLGLYQDLIEHQITKGNMGVLNMLNTKYFIGNSQDGRTVAQLNPGAFGPCWLVKGIKFVDSPNEEMLALDSTNLRDTAVLNSSFKAVIKQLPVYDSLAYIKISERQNDKITYASSAATPQFAVLSEIYYNRGWNAYLDGKKVEYAKVNYLLRGIELPAGKHSIEFRFEPKAYYTGNSISFWSIILIYLALIATVFFALKKNK
ncbi:MAG: YfhO family protein [Ferruginibacter sp.]